MALAGIPSISQPAQALSDLALVTPILSPAYGPISDDGQSIGPSLMFDFEGENSVILKSDITDQFIEDNTSVQDQIALKPEMVTVHGFKGELANTFPAGLPPATQVQAILGAIGAFQPGFSKSATNVINGVAQDYQAVTSAVNGAVSAWSTINGGLTETVIASGGILATGAVQTKQQLIFSQFYGYWRNGVLFTVQTPWAIFSPMAIEEIKFTQDEKTNTITDVFITFKMMRFVSTSPNNGPQSTGRAQNQSAPLTQNGSASLTQAQNIVSQLKTQSLIPGA